MADELGQDADRILEGVSTVFESLGRALVCLNPQFQVVHASVGLDHLIGRGAIDQVVGRSAEEVFGPDLFGPAGNIRRALESGDRREGWGATLEIGEHPSRLVSITAAPIRHGPSDVCDPRVAYVVVMRPGELDEETGSAAPTIFAGLVARSTSMLKIFSLVEHLETSDATVLITGESGTGKELVARAVHAHSPRAGGPFVAVNCGALPGELLESELFGHVRGAFTGAVRDRVGRFELAAGGTIFLDEVGDLPLHLQVKLLRVLQEHTYEALGDSRPRTAEARVVAATNRNLRQAVLEGEFRDDLYYRLRVVPIEVPPLRTRREDIEPLARHLLSRVNRRHDRSVQLSPGALRTLLRYRWPGNVRELENALEYAVAVSRGQTLHEQDLPQEVQDATEPSGSQRDERPARAEPDSRPRAQEPANPTLDQVERRQILEALELHRWRRSAAARSLGISRTTLWRKMREMGLLEGADR